MCKIIELYVSKMKGVTWHDCSFQEKLPAEQLFDRRVLESEPLKPTGLDDTPFTYVEDRKTLEVLATKLKNATEFAVSSHTNSISRCSCFHFIHIKCCFCL